MSKQVSRIWELVEFFMRLRGVDKARQIAEAVGCSEGMISGIKTGRYQPGADLTIKIADFLQAPRADLLRAAGHHELASATTRGQPPPPRESERIARQAAAVMREEMDHPVVVHETLAELERDAVGDMPPLPFWAPGTTPIPAPPQLTAVPTPIGLGQVIDLLRQVIDGQAAILRAIQDQRQSERHNHIANGGCR